MRRIDTLYARLPLWGQHAAVSAYGIYWHWLRFGPGYAQHVEDYASRERLTIKEWNDWQRRQFLQLLSAAADRVPYYRDRWDSKMKSAARDGRLAELPLLDKEPLRADPKAFLREDLKARNPLIFHTSGSTGTPIATYWTRDELRNSLALREVRSARWAGVSFRIPRATFSGRMIEPDTESKGPFYRFNVIERQVYLSPFHLRSDTAAAYVEALRRHEVQWLTGYAVSYYLLAKFILEQDLQVPPLRALVTTSEKVTPEMRTTMEMAYRCRVYEEYSTVENAVFASECECRRLHVSPDAGVVEILRPDGSPCDAGETGDVVTTCLMRTYQPLIRFKLGDLAAWDPEPCPCGRAMPVLKEVVGRIEDIVVGPDGRQMVRFHGIFVDQPHIAEGQIVQESLDTIRVRVVPINGYGQTDDADIERRIKQRLGPKVRVLVEKVDRIPRSKAGKFRAVISLLSKAANQEASNLQQLR